MATQKINRPGQQRKRWREEFWPDEEPWTGQTDVGWFRAPRTLALILHLIGSKALSGNIDPGSVYLELLTRHIDNGVVEMSHEADHAYAAGYVGSRAVRTWQERMKKLEELGLIKIKQIGNQRYKYVLLIHPTVAMQKLYDADKIPNEWWEAFRTRQIQTREERFEERQLRKAEAKAVN